MKAKPFLTVLIAALSAAAPALAHEGDHTHMTGMALLRHVVSEPDHLLMLGLLAVVVAALVLPAAVRRARR